MASAHEAHATYREAPPRIKRVALAIFLCGIVACLLVTMLGVGLLLGLRGVEMVFFGGAGNGFDDNAPSFFRGAMFAGLAGAFNWFFGYLTIPAAWLALGLSVGRFPGRRVVHRGAYLSWAAGLGALLVAVPTVLGVTGFAPDSERDASVLAGAALTSLGIGGLAGSACAGLFLLIVRPARQVAAIDLDVFSDRTVAEA
ncbi:MAG: hypothetical protein AAFQ18_11215 [Pseudomonadota bacterium]